MGSRSPSWIISMMLLFASLAYASMTPLLPRVRLAEGPTSREKTNRTNNICTAHFVLKESVWLFSPTPTAHHFVYPSPRDITSIGEGPRNLPRRCCCYECAVQEQAGPQGSVLELLWDLSYAEEGQPSQLDLRPTGSAPEDQSDTTVYFFWTWHTRLGI